ncbi:putative nicotinamide N-methyase [Parvibaculum indicum]|uniref:class I SAM-dependent methyltransferase n=1 Tax=Parvibaculum indicum TaxID=562969 RepID=UPI001420D0DE|nr:methyltransferase [Parvibaculum indicum]NIJ41798.1 putative nicotinamide N-methyase [Parvibaculum indicum]
MVRIGDPSLFIRKNTELLPSPLVPEIRLHVASDALPLWEMTEEELEQAGLPPPFWAFAWAGGQALARYILDHPNVVRGKRVLDFGAGSGLDGIAAAMSGAAFVLSADIDHFSGEAIRLNAEVNYVSLLVSTDDLVGQPNRGWDVVLVGDMCYEQPLAGRIESWLRGFAGAGVTVLIGDPGRTYLPKSGMELLATYNVETTRALEDNDVRRTNVWRLLKE